MKTLDQIKKTLLEWEEKPPRAYTLRFYLDGEYLGGRLTTDTAAGSMRRRLAAMLGDYDGAAEYAIADELHGAAYFGPARGGRVHCHELTITAE